MCKKHDYTLDTLISLDGFIAEVGKGYWIKIEARKVKSDIAKPYGIKYSLTLHDPKGERILGYDNAHSIPSKPLIKAHDHMHRSGKIINYHYQDAIKLLDDFWEDVDRILREEN